MRDADGRFLYIGKAANLRRRVSSYYLRPHDARIEKLVREIATISYEPLDTAIEALIREARLIKEHQPLYNIREKGSTSFLYVEIVHEEFPRVHLVRGASVKRGERFGPFTSATSIREAMKIIRRIFPFATHASGAMTSVGCFDYQIGLCPGTCIGGVSLREYRNTIRQIKLFFEGRKRSLLALMKREMKMASNKLEFEDAGRVRAKIFALEHINDVALIRDGDVAQAGEVKPPLRIEGYDISHISGTSAVGSMVVLLGGEPSPPDYRRFRIKTVQGSDDTAMLREVLSRRLRNPWPLPDLILVDGGKGQVNAMAHLLALEDKQIPVLGLAKGAERKRNDLIGEMPSGVTLAMLIRIRDEAHRFAVAYHRLLRSRR